MTTNWTTLPSSAGVVSTGSVIDHLQTYTLVTRPAAGDVGRIIYQTDGTPGIYLDNGSSWILITSFLDVKLFGCKGDGITDDSLLLQRAIDTGATLLFPAGTYMAHGLTQSMDFQCFFGFGRVVIQKNQSGVLFSSTGNGVQLHNLSFYGDSATPVYTGDNLNFTGDNIILQNCGSRYASGRAVKSIGQHIQILGTSDIYETTDTSGYDIELGVAGTATLYHQISNIYTSTDWGGILTIDTGSTSINGSQFGKLTINQSGLVSVGINGGNYTTNRILGDVSVNISNSEWAANHFGDITISFASGTTNHGFDETNTVGASATIVDNSSFSYIVDQRDLKLQNYTPTWTAASVNPAIGNGLLAGTMSKCGKFVDVEIYADMGSTTTFGSGVWYFSLPFIPSNNVPYVGSAYMLVAGAAFYVGAVSTLTDGTARAVLYANNTTNNVKSDIPETWASGDFLRATIRYAVT